MFRSIRATLFPGGEVPARRPDLRMRLSLQSLESREVPAALAGAGPAEAFARAAPAAAQSQPNFFGNEQVRGASRWDAATRMRGFMITPETLGEAGALDNLAAWHVDILRVELVGSGQSGPEYVSWLKGQLAKISAALPGLRSRGMGVIIDMHDPPGAGGANEDVPHALFHDRDLRQQYFAALRTIAETFASSPEVIAIDLLNEPTFEQVGGKPTAADFENWNAVVRRAHDVVRSTEGLNSTRTLIVESVSANPDWLRHLRPRDFAGSNVAFSFHMYDPSGFTHYDVPKTHRPLRLFGPDQQKHAAATLERVEQWQKANRVRIFVGEFSASYVPVANSAADRERKESIAEYLKWCIQTFDRYHWDWTYHAYREAALWDLEKTFGEVNDPKAPPPLWESSRLLHRLAQNPSIYESALRSPVPLPARIEIRSPAPGADLIRNTAAGGTPHHANALPAPPALHAKAGVFRNGEWFLDTNGDGIFEEQRVAFGLPGDTPFAADWDGNGTADLIVVRANAARGGLDWYVDLNRDGQVDDYKHFGLLGDIPIVGDWDGDGRADMGAVRVDAARGGLDWYLDLDRRGENAERVAGYGLLGDIPIAGDWNGDGRTDYGVIRAAGPNLVAWLDLDGAGGNAEKTQIVGRVGDAIVAGDWNGDRKTDFAAVAVGPDGLLSWAFDIDGDGRPKSALRFGLPGDRIVAGRW